MEEKEITMSKKPTQQDVMHLLDNIFKNTHVDVKKPEDISKALKIMRNNPALKSMLSRMGINNAY